jgi:hypothetical protein
MGWDWSAATKAQMRGQLFAIKAFLILVVIFTLGRCMGLIEAAPERVHATPTAPQSLAERDAEVRAMAAQREAQAKAVRAAEK